MITYSGNWPNQKYVTAKCAERLSPLFSSFRTGSVYSCNGKGKDRQMRRCGPPQPLGRACAMLVALTNICFLPQGHQEAAQRIISRMWVKTFAKFPKWKSKMLHPNTCLENTHLFCTSVSSTGQMLEFLPNWGRSTENEKQRCLFPSLRTFKTLDAPDSTSVDMRGYCLWLKTLKTVWVAVS